MELPAGAFTIGGKSRGPAVALGRNRYNKSQTIFLGEPELRQAIQDMGWPQPEDLADANDALATQAQELGNAQAELSELAEKLATLEQTVGFKTHVSGLEEKASRVDDLEEQLAARIAEVEKLQQAAASESKAKKAPKPKKTSKSKAKK